MAVTDIVRDDSDRSYVDWPAIFAGALIASGAVVVLTTFAAGLGLGSVSADNGGDISGAWLILTGLFVVISMVASYLLGGYVAGRMRRPAGNATKDELTTRDGLNGLVVWGIGMLLTGLLALSAVSGGARAVGGAAQTAVEAAGSAVQGAGQVAGGVISGTLGDQSNPLDYFSDALFRVDAPAAAGAQPGDNAGVQRQVTGIFGNLLRTGEISDGDRTWIRNQVAARTGLTPAEVDTRVNQAVDQVTAVRTEAEKQVEAAKTQAAEAAETVRIAGVLSAFLLAASALIGAVAAYVGAVRGGRHRDEGRIWGGLAYHR